jgi:hypothetical protein
MLTGASAFALNNTFTGTQSAAEHVAAARAAGTPASLRAEKVDPGLNFGGAPDDISALLTSGRPVDFGPRVHTAVLPVTFDLLHDITRARDGRTRAPPEA